MMSITCRSISTGSALRVRCACTRHFLFYLFIFFLFKQNQINRRFFSKYARANVTRVNVITNCYTIGFFFFFVIIIIGLLYCADSSGALDTPRNTCRSTVWTATIAPSYSKDRNISSTTAERVRREYLHIFNIDAGKNLPQILIQTIVIVTFFFTRLLALNFVRYVTAV